MSVLLCRFGPRQIRAESAMLRAYNSGTRAAPYESLMVADIGDVNVNVYDLKDTCRRIREHYRTVLATGCIPLTMGENLWNISNCATLDSGICLMKTLSGYYYYHTFECYLEKEQLIITSHLKMWALIKGGYMQNCQVQSNGKSDFVYLNHQLYIFGL